MFHCRDITKSMENSYQVPHLRHSPSLSFSPPAPPPPPPPSYSSSVPSSHFLRSSSINSLCPQSTIPAAAYSQPYLPSSPSSSDFLDFRAQPFRRVFSTGDLQGMNGTQVPGDNTSQEAGVAINGRVGRYSAEERKERIERYRSKRNQRNFQKKITYACRKTLADSRPRVRGRFARNGETETETETETEAETEMSYHGYEACDTYSCSNDHHVGGANWWREMEETLQTDQEEECCFDSDVWANLLEDLTTNLLS